ncbi:DnaJ- protein scj1 [Metarhizium acridum]|uniref:DnaJ domain containing protein n=1 Tax=Metarhizium acridum (strain CQMa 102) TaxID=655827 RepID=E9E4X1_METAQ|nr:DnaJ domain containing protein [Metarhizium acridum CQMa 102]EFY88988.1 DnaJ domain containing protein [Metarhizium acridum CQMa 102]KAG8404869.1 DnaJ- protein scj1 [Metarhizium acridum]
MLLHGFALLALLALMQLAICAEDYYKILGVHKQATDKQLKTAYKKLAVRFHPDKHGGDEEAHRRLVEISEAYEVLSDAGLRDIYDRHGHEGVLQHKNGGQGGGGFHDPFDLFSRFFGGHGHFGHSSQEPRGHNVDVKMKISLRDFYNGATTEFQWNRQHICETCEGTGSADGQVDTCSVCGGHGVRIVKQQLAPGMFQQMQMRCDACGGRGKSIKNKCPVCNGQRVERKPTTVTLKVERGAARDSKVVYENEADESPDWVAGDLVVTLAEKEPAPEDNPDKVDGVYFRRKGDDLYWTEVLSLREAWMGGWTRNITHLDSHIVRLGRTRGQVVQSGHVETIPGEGMPKWHEDGESPDHQHEFGNLYVTYEVILPDQMDKKMESDFWDLWEKWRAKKGVDLHKDSGRPESPIARDEL